MITKSESVEGERGESHKTEHHATVFLPAPRGRQPLKLQDCMLEPETARESRREWRCPRGCGRSEV